MAAGLIGHPGGYYTQVSGGEPGNMYTAELLVSPPNLARMLYSFGGFLNLLVENFMDMGESNPDTFTALDFDDLNLDFLLLTSELPALNQHSYYTYKNTDGLDTWYAWYWANTLGYLESKVNTASGGMFDSIRPTCIDGRPQYEFINRTAYDAVLPQNILYGPIVLSQERYDQLDPAPGHLVAQVQCEVSASTEGIDAYALEDVEHKAGYKAKIPINDNGFEYPIQYIFIDIVEVQEYDITYFAQDFEINENYYTIEDGNLYFTRTLEEIIAEMYLGQHDLDLIPTNTWADDLAGSEAYYEVNIVFDLFVPDTTEETSSLALSQATFYTIMDYFNQYTYAEVTASMISEIAYTETVTFWSTLISAPLVYLGSWTAAGLGEYIAKAGKEVAEEVVETTLEQSLSAMIYKTLLGFITAPINEVFQEIIEDGFIEALCENVVDMLGGTDSAGFWASSFATSLREGGGSLAKLSALGQAGGGLKNALSIIKSGDKIANKDLMNKLAQNLQQKQDRDLQYQNQKKTWQKLLSSGFFKGLSMIMSTIYFGGFNYFTLRSLSNFIGDVKGLSPKDYGKYKAQQHVNSKALLPTTLPENPLSDNLKESAKRPAGINEGSLHTIFRGMQETGIVNTPVVDISILFNPNPKTEQRNELAKTFNEIRDSDLFEAIEVSEELPPDRAEFLEDEAQLTEKRLKTSDLEIKITSGDDYEGLFAEFNKIRINYIHSMLFDPNYDQNKPEKVLDQIRYRSDLILEAREILRATRYCGLQIIIDENINPEVLAILQEKFNSGEEWTKLERIIADVAAFYMGKSSIDRKVNSESHSNENLVKKLRFEKTDENLKKVGVMQQRGTSMPLEPGGKVPYIKHESGKKYEIGQIIVYRLENGLIVYHQVVGYKDTVDGRVYETQGINNQDPDSKEVYDHQIIGQVVKFSKQDLAYLIQMAEMGRIDYIEGLGMTKQSELVVDIAKIFYDNTKNPYFDIQYSFTRFSEFITSKSIGSIDSNYFSDLMAENLNKKGIANKIIDLMYKIQSLDYGDIKRFKGFKEMSVDNGLRLLNTIKSASLMKCAEYMKSEILTDYTSKLFNKYTASLSSSTINSDNLIFVIDTLNHIDQFHRLEKAQTDLAISTGNQISNTNEFTQDIWGESYTKLLRESVINSKFLDPDLINILEGSENMYGDIIKIYTDTLLGITEGPSVEGMNIYTLYIGEHNYLTEGGYGLEHIIQRHFDKQFERWGYDSSKEIYNFVLETLRDNPNFDFEEDNIKGGGSLFYQVVDKNGIARTLEIVISSKRFIVTAIPH